MNGLRNSLLKEQFRLENIINKVKDRLKMAPEGSLRLSKSHNHIQYYWCKEESKTGNYISKNNIELAHKLAQKSYDKKVLALAEKRLFQISRMMKDYDDYEIEKIYSNEHIERQKLIEPIEPTWEQKVAIWKAKEYKGKDRDKSQKNRGI